MVTVIGEQAAMALRVFAPSQDAERSYRDGFPAATAVELYQLVQSACDEDGHGLIRNICR